MRRSLKQTLFYKLTIAAALLLALLLSLPDGSITSVALEQEACCQMEEHLHGESCYLEEVLLCRKKAHTHNENCYLVLLEHNDINWLLQTVDDTQNKTLASVVDSAIGQALVLNDNYVSVSPPVTLRADDISSLNETIQNENVVPAVTLNQNLVQGTLFAVGDDPVSGSSAVNFYMLLDGNEIVLVSSGTLDSQRRYTYANTAKAYSEHTVTALTAANFGSASSDRYQIRYNTDGDTNSVSDFTGTVEYQNNNSRMRFSSSWYARHALLTDKNGAAIPFYTVSLDYSAVDSNRGPDTQYVESGQSSTLALSDEYLWYTEDGTPVTAMPSTITKTTKLYAGPKAYIATFVDSTGKEIAEPYERTPINGILSVPLPNLAGTARQGYYWIVQGSDGETYYPSDGTQSVNITDDTVFVAIPDTYTVTFLDDSGILTEKTVPYRGSVTLNTLPDEFYWYDDAGNRYNGGATYGPVTEDVTLTASTMPVFITYQVNFPSGAVGSVDTVPKIYGTEASTITDEVRGHSTVTRSLTSRTARREVSSGNKESVTYFFQGWTIEGSDVLIPPDSVLTWSQLKAYAGSGDQITLKGVWEDGGRYNSATFFVRFDSQAVDTDGNITSQPTENYTPEIFNTHVGGVDTSWTDAQIKDAYEIADTTSDNSFGADQSIRALYGEKAEGLWLYDFPKDDDVFLWLKDYLQKNPTRQLTVEGESVDPAELDKSHYVIRWYVFKLEGSSWHVDGKLCRKYGSITVDKTFGGDPDAVAASKQNFHIVSENGTRDANGVFTAYPTTDKHFRQIVLTLDQPTADALRSAYPQAEFHVVDLENQLHTIYEWQITDVMLDEYWHIYEVPAIVPGYSYYAEYSIYDTDGIYSAIAEYGTAAHVVGKVFALDEDPDQGLMVDFCNYYYPEDSILLKKEDAKTGQGIGGAVFEMWQNGKALNFDYDPVTGIYSQTPDGATDKLTTGEEGYAVIRGFSYLHGDSTGDCSRDGDITIKEVVPPSGYDKAPDAELGLDASGNVILKNVAGIAPEEWSKHAAVPGNEIAIIRDHVSDYISVTVSKIWNTSTPADSVEVVLQANGSHAAALFPGMTNAQVRLHGGNLWQYTWYDLPRYANGKPVDWGVKEVVVGGMPTLSDGVTFANWIATYSPGVGTDTDDDGDVDNWSFSVTNTTRRPQLIITKVGAQNTALPGAVFTLERVVLSGGSWVSGGEPVVTMTSNEHGMLTFDQLLAGSCYRLTETHPPDGYILLAEPIILTVNGEGAVQQVADDGTVQDLQDPYITYTGPYNLRVVNLQMTTLPETGGTGPGVYWQSGTLLLLLAAALLECRIKRRKEETDSS